MQEAGLLEGFVEVQPDEERPFRVLTPTRELTALGTRFAVDVEAGATSLLVRGYEPVPDTELYGAELIPRVRALVARYDAGQDSYDAIGLPRPDQG